MENIANLDDFFNTSSKIGSNWFLSQANGGNTSIKFNINKIYLEKNLDNLNLYLKLSLVQMAILF